MRPDIEFMKKTNQSPSDGELSHLLNLNLAATDWNKGGFWQDAVIMKNGNLQLYFIKVS